MYFHEINRKNEIDRNISIIISAISLEIGMFLYFIKEIYEPLFIPNSIKCAIVIVISIIFILILYKLIRFLIAYDYLYIPSSEEYNNYLSQLKTYFNTNNINDNSEKELLNEIYNQYNKCASHNKYSNDCKTADYYWLRVCIIINFSLMGLLILYHYIYLTLEAL